MDFDDDDLDVFDSFEKVNTSIIRSEKTKKAVELIEKVYATCATGGYCHIVTDDNNIEDGFITWCIDSAEKKILSDWVPESSRLDCLECLLFLQGLTEVERYSVIKLRDEKT